MTNQPFNDPNNGLFIRTLLQQYKVNPSTTFLGYLHQYPLAGPFNPTSDTAQISLAQLRRDLHAFKPNLVLILGEAGLRLATTSRHKLNDFRGSLFLSDVVGSPFQGLKCLATLDVARTMTTNYDSMPLLKFDVMRAIKEASIPDLSSIPRRTFELNLSSNEIIDRLQKLPSRYAFDIEGGVPNPTATSAEHRFPTGITCLSIATTPTDAFIIPFHTFPVKETSKIILALRSAFADPTTEKILQNGMYDTFALAWLYSIHVANFWWDTMLSGFELYPELPKALGVQTSLYTYEPYYKSDRLIDDQTTHWAYCCKDSCVTYEIALKHLAMMRPSQLAHFREVNMAMLPILLYLQLRGMAFDQEKANTFLSKVHLQMHEIQTRINTRLGHALNINSPKQMTNCLYSTLGFPKQHPPKKTGHGLDKTKLTADIDAILEISQRVDAPILHEILAWRKLEKIRSSLEIRTDRDKRVRCSYNPVGTDTNRLSSSKSPTGNGANLQTITKKLRNLYSSGPSVSSHTPGPRYFFQVDLSGADGWTVAAHCNKFGDPTMLDDYLAGIKPARVIGLMHIKGAEVSRLSRDQLKIDSKIVGEGEYEALYFTCKQVQHGSNYYLGHAKMAKLITKSSYKQLGQAIRVSTSMCAALQDLYFARYKGVKQWQRWIESEIQKHGTLGCASGHVRTFHGRRNNTETYRKAYAHEPQHNTTYATNRAIINLWNDPENRNPDGSLIIEPHHQVHDALNGSFPVDRTDWAVSKIRSYFNFTIPIAGQDICIPFEGEYGDSWGHTIGHI